MKFRRLFITSILIISLITIPVVSSAESVLDAMESECRAVYDERNAAIESVKSAEQALAELQGILEEAEAEENDAKDAVSAAQSVMEAAKAVLEADRQAVADINAEAIEIEKASVQLETDIADKEAEIQLLENKVADLETAAGDIIAEVEAAEKALEEAEAAVAEAEAKYISGSYAFFEAMGCESALKALNECTYEGYNQEGKKTDATNIELMKKSLDFMKQCNELRKAHGLGELKVTDELMAMAQSNVNYADSRGGHSGQFNVGENLAWGWEDPFDAWYNIEKENYETQNGEQTGHYLNIIDKDYKYTGYAISSESYLYEVPGWETHGQTFHFSSKDKAYTVDEYIDRFNEYYDSITTVPKENLEKAQQRLEDAEKAMAYEESGKALIAVREELNTAKAELEEMKIDFSDKAEELDALKASIPNLENKIIASEKAVTAAETELTAAQDALDKAEADRKEKEGPVAEAKAEVDAAKDVYAEVNERCVKAEIKLEVIAYKELDDYREAEQAELIEIVKHAAAAIDTARDYKQARQIADDAQAAMDAVKTDEQLTAIENGFPGDANVDEKVNVKDAVLVLQYANRKVGEDKLALALSDVNGDGKVNVKDATMILQYANKKINKFPVE